MIYRISVGHGGSAFQHIGDYRLTEIPRRYAELAKYLRAHPDVVDLCVTSEKGENVVFRRMEVKP
jgi:hypothetical protein